MTNQEIVDKLKSLGLLEEYLDVKTLTVLTCTYHLQELVDNKMLSFGGRMILTEEGHKLGKLVVDSGFKITEDHALVCLQSMAGMFDLEIADLLPSVAHTIVKVNEHGMDWLFNELITMSSKMSPDELEQLRRKQSEWGG